MSYTTLFVVKPDGSLVEDGELRNAWGSAPRIWDAAYRRYLHPKPRFSYVPHEEIDCWLLVKEPDRQRFWDLAGDEAVPLFARRTLEFTYDQIVVPPGECSALADAIEQFDRVLPPEPGTVNHLPALLEWLRKCAERKDIEGVCVNWTSVSDCFPSVPLDDEDKDYRPYNIHADGGHRMRTFAEGSTVMSERVEG